MTAYLVTSGQTLSGVTLGSSDAEYVLPGGTASSTIINGGFQDDAGTATGTTINGGYQFVEAGGSASNTTINGGGGQLIMSGGIATSTTINSGGEQDDYGTTSGTVINTGGVEIVESSGVAIGTVINGGVQYLYRGGSAKDTTLSSGLQWVEFGGSASNTTVNGGEQLVMSGATATGTVVNGGYQNDYGTAIGVTLNAGYQLVESGATASNTTINNTGVEYVEAGGLATGTIVNGGMQYVYAGGTARNTTINGGFEYVASGAVASGVTFGGTTGTLQLQQAGSLTGTIAGWRVGDAIDFLNSTVTSAVINGTTLQITMSGGQSFNYQLAGQQAGTIVQVSNIFSGSELRLVAKPPPVVTEALAHDTGISSTDRITTDPTLTGSGDPNATVHFTIDGTSIAATATADTKGLWSYTPTGLGDGVHTIVASETDAAGQTATASLTFRLDTDKDVAPSLVVGGGSTPIVNAAASHSVAFAVAGLDDEAGTVIFSDGKNSISVAISGNGNYTVDLSPLADGPISSALAASDIAGNSFSASGNPITLDTDKDVKPVLLVNGGQPVIGVVQDSAVAFTVSGLDDEAGTATFSDGSHSVTVAVSGNGAYAANLNGLNPATITSTLNVGDAAGNRFAVTGNPLTIDPGPSAGTGATAVGHDKTIDLTAFVNGLIIPGIAGDSESITAVSAAHGTTTLSNGAVTYTAPANGSDTLSFTVADQYGDTATGTVNLTVDPGPTAGTGATTVGHDKTVDLTALVNGLIIPGFAGDSESITAVGAAYGTASISNGVVTYTGPSNGSDAITYTVADQYGDTASGMINVTIDPGPSAGAASIMVAAGASTDLTAYCSALISRASPATP